MRRGFLVWSPPGHEATNAPSVDFCPYHRVKAAGGGSCHKIECMGVRRRVDQEVAGGQFVEYHGRGAGCLLTAHDHPKRSYLDAGGKRMQARFKRFYLVGAKAPAVELVASQIPRLQDVVIDPHE